jgi:two-component system sensor histidine kinase/response regulator
MIPSIECRNPRVLFIEDQPILQRIYDQVLNDMGFEVVIVSDPKSAMNLWEDHWDLIFSDIGLPEMSGIELCQKRRDFEKNKGIYTRAFAYSAFNSSTIKNECLAAGFDGFGNKPMPHEKLYEELQNLLPQFKLRLPL